MLSSHAEPNSAVPCLMVLNGVLLPCLSGNDYLFLVRHCSSTMFGTGLSGVNTCLLHFFLNPTMNSITCYRI